jgi:hypothetical protein
MWYAVPQLGRFNTQALIDGLCASCHRSPDAMDHRQSKKNQTGD